MEREQKYILYYFAINGVTYHFSKKLTAVMARQIALEHHEHRNLTKKSTPVDYKLVPQSYIDNIVCHHNLESYIRTFQDEYEVIL